MNMGIGSYPAMVAGEAGGRVCVRDLPGDQQRPDEIGLPGRDEMRGIRDLPGPSCRCASKDVLTRRRTRVRGGGLPGCGNGRPRGRRGLPGGERGLRPMESLTRPRRMSAVGRLTRL